MAAIGASPQVEPTSSAQQRGDCADGSEFGRGRAGDADAGKGEEVAGEAEVDGGSDGDGVVLGVFSVGVRAAVAVLQRGTENSFFETLVRYGGVPFVGEDSACGCRGCCGS